MRSEAFPTRSLTPLLTAVAAFGAIPATAAACSLCSLSYFHLTFPFLDGGLVILGLWRAAYLIWQASGARLTGRDIAVAVGKRAALIAFLYMFAFRAGIFLYLLGSLVKALILAAKTLGQSPSPPLTRLRKRSLILIHALALALLAPVAGLGYWQRSRADDLERLVRYAYPGTAPSRVMAARIAGNPKFNLERLRPVLKNSDRNVQETGFEILGLRRKASDALRFRDVLERIPAAEFDTRTTHYSWLLRWTAQLSGREQSTKAEFFDWLDRQYVPATDDEPATGPQANRAGRIGSPPARR